MNNLPPGVTDSMIPGNRPEDQERPIELWISQSDIDTIKYWMRLGVVKPRLSVADGPFIAEILTQICKAFEEKYHHD